MATQELLLALDFGGTKLAAGIAQPGRSELLAHGRKPTPSEGTPEHTLPVVQELANDLLAQVDGSVVAVGTSFGGPLMRPETGKIRHCPHLPGWEDYPLKAWLIDAFGARAIIENDANAAAVGEWCYGAGRGLSSILYITVSTGIGSGLVLDGRLYRGHDNLAGEFGHMILVPGGPACSCGRQGCLEALAAGPAIAREAREALKKEPEHGHWLRSLCSGQVEDLTARDVAQAANQGDDLARAILEEAASHLGTGIANAVNLLNPERVILGGGVVKSGTMFLDAVRGSAASHVFDGMTLDIVLAEYDELAPLWGAIALAQELCEVQK